MDAAGGDATVKTPHEDCADATRFPRHMKLEDSTVKPPREGCKDALRSPSMAEMDSAGEDATVKTPVAWQSSMFTAFHAAFLAGLAANCFSASSDDAG